MYHSQIGQDKFLNEQVFNFKENGFFIEVGASDGIKYSNSLFFEESLGWTGICIEPNPSAFMELKLNRECFVHECAIDIDDGFADFTKNVGYTEQLSGITKYYDPRQLSRIAEWIDGNADDGGVVNESGSSTTIKVATRRLDSILNEHQIDYVDYISIDVEGAEISVLKSIDFDAVYVDVIGFEVNWSEPALDTIEFLSSNGFVKLANVGHDIFMINAQSKYVRTDSGQSEINGG